MLLRQPHHTIPHLVAVNFLQQNPFDQFTRAIISVCCALFCIVCKCNFIPIWNLPGKSTFACKECWSLVVEVKTDKYLINFRWAERRKCFEYLKLELKVLYNNELGSYYYLAPQSSWFTLEHDYEDNDILASPVYVCKRFNVAYYNNKQRLMRFISAYFRVWAAICVSNWTVKL